MNSYEFIKAMIDGKAEYFKKERLFNIDYVFMNENSYNKFMNNNLSLWARELPPDAVKKFNEERFFVFVTDEMIQNNDYMADGTFIFSKDEAGKKINSLIIEVDDNPHVLYHEFGHFVDTCMGNSICEFSNDIAVKAIILLEGTRFAHLYSINYMKTGFLREAMVNDTSLVLASATYYLQTQEYFAEAFALYFSNRKLLELMCPETYKYISNVYKSLL